MAISSLKDRKVDKLKYGLKRKPSLWLSFNSKVQITELSDEDLPKNKVNYDYKTGS